MSAPNIATAGSALGKSVGIAIGTSPATAVTTPANHLIKIVGLIVANVDGGNTADVTVDLYRSSTPYRVAYLVTVPAKTSLPVLGKDFPLYMEEGDSLRLTASVAGILEAVISYEDVA